MNEDRRQLILSRDFFMMFKQHSEFTRDFFVRLDT